MSWPNMTGQWKYGPAVSTTSQKICQMTWRHRLTPARPKTPRTMEPRVLRINIGREHSQAGIPPFPCLIYVTDGSPERGNIGAGFCRHEGETAGICKIGRDEEGSSSNRAEHTAACIDLKDAVSYAGSHRLLFLLTDSKCHLMAIQMAKGSTSNQKTRSKKLMMEVRYVLNISIDCIRRHDPMYILTKHPLSISLIFIRWSSFTLLFQSNLSFLLSWSISWKELCDDGYLVRDTDTMIPVVVGGDNIEVTTRISFSHQRILCITAHFTPETAFCICFLHTLKCVLHVCDLDNLLVNHCFVTTSGHISQAQQQGRWRGRVQRCSCFKGAPATSRLHHFVARQWLCILRTTTTDGKGRGGQGWCGERFDDDKGICDMVADRSWRHLGDLAHVGAAKWSV